jgi:ATP-dependent helicase/nuclease subunit A
MDISSKEAMTRDVNCPGKWVLYSALKRTEAGELFALGTKPRETTMSSCPWLIRVLDGSVAEAVSGTAVEAEKTVEEKDIRFLERALVFQYDHIGATLAPSKQTATQRKGRQKDQEAAENAKEPEPQQRHWRKPALSSTELDPTAYGTAMHRVLQYIRFSSCTDEDSIRKEINRLTLEGFLKQEHADRIDAVGLTRFFATELGWKLIHTENVLREFKFSILDDAREYGEGLEEELVLLQGVVDCAIVEPDGITIIDFKTDHVTADTVDTVAERYSPQINTYAAAMTRIYRKPVKGKALYFFRMGKTYWL